VQRSWMSGAIPPFPTCLHGFTWICWPWTLSLTIR